MTREEMEKTFEELIKHLKILTNTSETENDKWIIIKYLWKDN